MEVSVVQFESREQGGEPSLREIEEGASMTILLLVVLSLTYLMFQYRSGKLPREKIFVNFAVLWLFAKVFSVKFGGMASFGVAQASN